MGTFLRPTV